MGSPPAEPVEPAAAAGPELLRRAQALGLRRERDFWRRVHELRIGHRPGAWNPRQRLALETWVAAWEAKTP